MTVADRCGILIRQSAMKHQMTANAPVAQLDRVFGYEPKGRGFESLLAYQVKESFSRESGSFSCFWGAFGNWTVPLWRPSGVHVPISVHHREKKRPHGPPLAYGFIDRSRGSPTSTKTFCSPGREQTRTWNRRFAEQGRTRAG